MSTTTVGVQHITLDATGDTDSDDVRLRPELEICAVWQAPSPWRVHGALILAQVIFGAGSVVGKLGVEKFNPLLFALIREGIAGPLLLAMAVCHDGCLTPAGGDWTLIVAMGFCVFANQAFAILGIKLAGPVISSAWQCSQPIFTLTISLLLGWEPPTWRKVTGILLSFLSGAFLVIYGHETGDAGAMGNIFLALNCLGTSLYVIFAKVALQRFPALTVTAWAMMAASLMMAMLALSLNSCEVVQFVCPPGNQHDFTCGNGKASCLPWHVPASAALPLTYFVLANSIGAYLLITWANSYARAGYVLAYTALQPFTSTVLSVILIVGWRLEGLEMPGWNALGCIGILMALVLLILDGKRQHEADEAKQGRLPTKASPGASCWMGTKGAGHSA